MGQIYLKINRTHFVFHKESSIYVEWIIIFSNLLVLPRPSFEKPLVLAIILYAFIVWKNCFLILEEAKVAARVFLLYCIYITMYCFCT